MKTIIAITILALTLGCSTSTDVPSIAADEMACAQCGMLVSDLAYAGAIRSGSEEKAFDDPVCLIRYVRSGKTGGATRIWFHDHSGEGWVDASRAVFVEQNRQRGPMGGDILAFGEPSAAQRSADAMRGRVIRSYSELLQSKGPQL